MEFWTTHLKNKESLKERVRRHIKDKNSRISDEDIRNVEIEFEIMAEADLIFNKNKKYKRNTRRGK